MKAGQNNKYDVTNRLLKGLIFIKILRDSNNLLCLSGEKIPCQYLSARQYFFIV